MKDLGARLPYKPQVEIIKDGTSITCKLTTATIKYLENGYWDVKPYLFPLSSMTEEQKEELYSKLIELELKKIHHLEVVNFEVEYYLKNHLDYMLLIPRGLAIDATGKNTY